MKKIVIALLLFFSITIFTSQNMVAQSTTQNQSTESVDNDEIVKSVRQILELMGVPCYESNLLDEKEGVNFGKYSMKWADMLTRAKELISKEQKLPKETPEIIENINGLSVKKKDTSAKIDPRPDYDGNSGVGMPYDWAKYSLINMHFKINPYLLEDGRDEPGRTDIWGIYHPYSELIQGGQCDNNGLKLAETEDTFVKERPTSQQLSPKDETIYRLVEFASGIWLFVNMNNGITFHGPSLSNPSAFIGEPLFEKFKNQEAKNNADPFWFDFNGDSNSFPTGPGLEHKLYYDHNFELWEFVGVSSKWNQGKEKIIKNVKNGEIKYIEDLFRSDYLPKDMMDYFQKNLAGREGAVLQYYLVKSNPVRIDAKGKIRPELDNSSGQIKFTIETPDGLKSYSFYRMNFNPTTSAKVAEKALVNADNPEYKKLMGEGSQGKGKTWVAKVTNLPKNVYSQSRIGMTYMQWEGNVKFYVQDAAMSGAEENAVVSLIDLGQEKPNKYGQKQNVCNVGKYRYTFINGVLRRIDLVDGIVKQLK